MTINRYWERDPEAPFATLMRFIDGYCHPEAFDEAYEELVELANDPDPGPAMRKFKEELRRALANPGQLPVGAVSTAAEHSQGNDEAFRHRLWHDLYSDEPIDRQI